VGHCVKFEPVAITRQPPPRLSLVWHLQREPSQTPQLPFATGPEICQRHCAALAAKGNLHVSSATASSTSCAQQTATRRREEKKNPYIELIHTSICDILPTDLGGGRCLPLTSAGFFPIGMGHNCTRKAA